MVGWDKKRYAEDPEYRRKRKEESLRYRYPSDLKRLYGISVQEHAAMMARQNGRCAICQRKPSGDTLCIDHCHETGKVRGLLCRKCNTGLGCYDDDPAFARKAAAYLEDWRRRHLDLIEMETKR
jgi:hypothetical protein